LNHWQGGLVHSLPTLVFSMTILFRWSFLKKFASHQNFRGII